MGIITGTVLFIITFYVYAFDKNPVLCTLAIPLVIITIVIELFRQKPNPLANIAVTIMGIVYVSLPMTLFNHFAFFNHHGYTYQVLFGFFLLLWINDTAAYLFGISFGKHRLFERISPKKSWEGFIGGTVMTLILAYLINLPFSLLSRIDWIVIGLIICVAGVGGDLVESMFKRSANIKDSGKILPGHGGILDRMDSVLLSSPLVFVYLSILK